MSKRKVVPPAEKFLSGVIVYEACSDRQLLDMIAKCAATLRERMDRSAPAAPKAPERGARAHICEICGSEWQLRYEAGSSIGYCPKCCPDEEAKRLASEPNREEGPNGECATCRGYGIVANHKGTTCEVSQPCPACSGSGTGPRGTP